MLPLLYIYVDTVWQLHVKVWNNMVIEYANVLFFYFFMVMKLKIPSMLDTFSAKSSIPGSGFASIGTARRFSSVGAISIFLWADDYSTCLTDCLTLGTVSFHFNFSNGCTETSHNGFYEHFPDNNNNNNSSKQGSVRLDFLVYWPL